MVKLRSLRSSSLQHSLNSAEENFSSPDISRLQDHLQRIRRKLKLVHSKDCRQINLHISENLQDG